VIIPELTCRHRTRAPISIAPFSNPQGLGDVHIITRKEYNKARGENGLLLWVFSSAKNVSPDSFCSFRGPAVDAKWAATASRRGYDTHRRM
jgi:hypothetical protein